MCACIQKVPPSFILHDETRSNAVLINFTHSVLVNIKLFSLGCDIVDLRYVYRCHNAENERSAVEVVTGIV